jgi:hypothetical protein
METFSMNASNRNGRATGPALWPKVRPRSGHTPPN